jgi:hypothetical protein
MSFRSRHGNATRSKSSDRAYDSTRRRDPNREERDGKRGRSVRPPTYGPAREPFSGSTAPEPGSTISPSPSPPPRRRQSTRDHERRRSGRHGYDGAGDDDGYIDYYTRDRDTSSSSSRRSRVSAGYTEPVPKNMAFHHQPVKTPSPLGPGLEHKLRHIPTLLKPPTPPDSDHAVSIL